MENKPGWKTTEFLLTVAAATPPFVCAIGGSEVCAAVTAAVVAIYTIARSFTKSAETRAAMDKEIAKIHKNG